MSNASTREVETRLRAELATAQEQVAALTAERDRQPAESGAGHHGGTSAELVEAQAKIAQLSDEAARIGAEHQKKLTQLTAEITSAQRTRDQAVSNVVKAQAQVQSLKGELDEERKQAKDERLVLEARILALEVQAGIPGAEARSRKLRRPPRRRAQLRRRRSKPDRSLTPAEITSAVADLAAACGGLAQTPAKPGLLDKLDSGLEEFSERARVTKIPAFHRSGVAALELTRWLRKTPAKSVGSGEGSGIHHPPQRAGRNQTSAAKISDISGAAIYAVDDDIDNCECIAMALEKLEFQNEVLRHLEAGPDTAQDDRR